MQIEIDKLKKAIDQAKEINEIYELHYIGAKNNNVKSTDDLRDLCSKYLQKNIDFYEHKLMHHKDHPIRGFFLAFDKGNRYEVALLSSQNYCWRRLVLCKELFHVILYDNNNCNKSIKSLIDEATTEKLQTERNKPTYEPLQWELLAEIAAMEFLFPYSEREKIIARLNVSSNNPNYGEIAEQYKIPRAIVEQYLSTSRMSVLQNI